MSHRLKGVRSTAAPVIRRTASYLVKQYASNPAVRHWYALVRDISSRTIYPVSPKLHELLFVRLKLYLRKQYLHRDGSSFVFTPESLYWPKKSIPIDFHPKVSVIVPSYNHTRFLRSSGSIQFISRHTLILKSFFSMTHLRTRASLLWKNTGSAIPV